MTASSLWEETPANNKKERLGDLFRILLIQLLHNINPGSKVHGANMPIWRRQDPGGPHVGPMNFLFGNATYHEPCDAIVYPKEQGDC